MYSRTTTTIFALIFVLEAHTSEVTPSGSYSSTCPPTSSYQPPGCSINCKADSAPICGYNKAAIRTFSNDCERKRFNKCSLPKGSKPYEKILNEACCPEIIRPIVVVAEPPPKRPTDPNSWK